MSSPRAYAIALSESDIHSPRSSSDRPPHSAHMNQVHPIAPAEPGNAQKNHDDLVALQGQLDQNVNEAQKTKNVIDKPLHAEENMTRVMKMGRWIKAFTCGFLGCFTCCMCCG